MTIEEAIQNFESLSENAEKIAVDFENTFHGWKSLMWRDKELYDMAIAALRVQQEAEKNEPLALEQLREMDGEPVWVVFDHDDGKYGLVNVDCEYVGGFDYLLGFESYGVWLAYRRKFEVDYCSECGKRLCSRYTNYCPNCGAKMEEMK